MSGPAKNALGTAMMNWLLERLQAAEGQPVLLTGTGDAFSAGLNLEEVASLDPAGMTTFLRLLERCMSALYQHAGPTVALVNGHAIAGGCVLTLACDYRVATDNARAPIGLNEVALGVRFPPRVLRIVRMACPRRRSCQCCSAPRLFTSAGALAHGLVDAVSADAGVVARARLAAARGPPGRRLRRHEAGASRQRPRRPGIRRSPGPLVARVGAHLDGGRREAACAQGAGKVAQRSTPTGSATAPLTRGRNHYSCSDSANGVAPGGAP